MVKHAITTYSGNPERVYATGDSSGGMMTELLLALYPDVFKAGSAMAGMPAGCRGANESGSGGGYSGACAGGSVTHTPQEWGNIARMLAPGYTGHRPRVQLFHGDADTIIRYANHTEAIKEWTNVLGVATNPTSTNTGVQFGTHQATRQRWQNSCGHVVLDAFTSIGGDHGPSDALFKAEYVIPFLGLDKTGAIDPEIEQCGSGADGGADAGGVGALAVLAVAAAGETGASAAAAALVMPGLAGGAEAEARAEAEAPAEAEVPLADRDAEAVKEVVVAQRAAAAVEGAASPGLAAPAELAATPRPADSAGAGNVGIAGNSAGGQGGTSATGGAPPGENSSSGCNCALGNQATDVGARATTLVFAALGLLLARPKRARSRRK